MHLDAFRCIWMLFDAFLGGCWLIFDNMLGRFLILLRSSRARAEKANILNVTTLPLNFDVFSKFASFIFMKRFVKTKKERSKRLSSDSRTLICFFMLFGLHFGSFVVSFSLIFRSFL